MINVNSDIVMMNSTFRNILSFQCYNCTMREFLKMKNHLTNPLKSFKRHKSSIKSKQNDGKQAEHTAHDKQLGEIKTRVLDNPYDQKKININYECFCSRMEERTE